MKRASVLSPLALCAALLAPRAVPPLPDPQAQDGRAQDQEGQGQGEADRPQEYQRDIYGRLRAVSTNPLKGCWKLVHIEADGYPLEGLDALGYLLVADDFLAFEMQAFYDETETKTYMEDGFQSFIAEYYLEGGNRLVCTNLIGAYLDEEDEELGWEAQGLQREFEIELEGDFLTLTWSEGDTMTFGRRRPRGHEARDIFGKRRPQTDNRGPDIYGRERRTDDDEDDGF